MKQLIIYCFWSLVFISLSHNSWSQNVTYSISTSPIYTGCGSTVDCTIPPYECTANAFTRHRYTGTARIQSASIVNGNTLQVRIRKCNGSSFASSHIIYGMRRSACACTSTNIGTGQVYNMYNRTYFDATGTLSHTSGYRDYYIMVEVHNGPFHGNHYRTARVRVYAQTISPCNTPSNLHINPGMTSTAATPDWSWASGAGNYTFQYRAQGSSFWQSYTTTSSSYSLSSLSPNTCYQWRVRTNCTSGNSSNWTSTQSFCTPSPPCSLPSTLHMNSTSTTTANPDWYGVSGANYYEFQYRVQGSSFWQSYTTTSSSYYLSNLVPNTCYEWRVRTNCGSFSSWTPIQSFCTLCQNPTIISQPTTQTICSGAPYVSFSVNVSNNTGGRWERNGVNLGTSNTTLTISNPTTANQGSYRYRAYNNCGTTYSNTVYLNVITPPSATFTTSGITRIGQVVSLQSSTSGNHNWTVSLPSGGTINIPNSTSANTNFTTSARGTYQITHSVGNLGCTETVTSTLDITPDYSHNRPVEASRNIKYEADPVNTATGEYKYAHSIMEVAGLNTSLDFDVYYLAKHLENRTMGYGWSHNWDIRMVRLSNPSGDLYIEFGDGYRMYFTEYTGSNPRILPTYKGTLDTLIKNTNGTYNLEFQSGDVFTFSNNGKLQSVSDLNNNSFNLTYTSSGVLSRVTAPGGRFINFGYTSNKLNSVTNQAGITASFVYGSNGNLTQLANARGGQFAYTYDNNHRITDIVDSRGILFIQNTYDVQGRVIRQKMADNGEWVLQHNSPTTNATTITDPEGFSKVYYYDNNWNLIREVDELNYSTYRAYNNNHWPIYTVNQQGDTSHIAYDVKGNITGYTSIMGKQSQSSYTNLNRPSNITNSLGINTGLSYNTTGDLTRIDLPNTGQVNLSRNANGTIASVIDAEGRSLSYTYSATGDITSISTPTGNITMVYDAIGRLTSITDQNTKATTITYDAYGNILRITSPSSAYVESIYDANGNLTSFQDKLGNTTTYAYDNKDALISITDPMSRLTTISRNLLNQITRIDYPSGSYIEYTYSNRGNVLTATNSLGTTNYTYNALGLATSIRYPNTYQINMSYDKDRAIIAYSDNLGKVDSLIRDTGGRVHKSKNALGIETTFNLNDMGELTGVTHAGMATSTYNVDLNGALTSVVDPNSNTTTNTIDPTTGRLMGSTDPLGSGTSISYDNVGNPTILTLANGISETITYNDDYYQTAKSWSNGYFENYTRAANGAVTGITNPSGTMSVTLNNNYEPTAITDLDGNTTSYIIGNTGFLDQISSNGRIIQKSYNPLGQELQTTDWQNKTYATTYSNAGIPQSFSYPNGVERTLDYRLDGFLMDLVYTDVNNDTIYYQKSTRNILGQVTAQEKPFQFTAANLAAANINYAYLDNDAQSNGIYTSDIVGNITTFPDGLGNTVLASYDQKNRIENLTIGTRTIVNTYDAGNFLIKQVDNGVEKRYIWDYAYGLPRIVGEADAAGNLLVSYVWANGMLVSRINEISGQQLYYLTDGTGNVVALTDSVGNITDTYTYGTFGEAFQHTGTTLQPFTWLGGYGIVHQMGSIFYIRQRWYDAAAGRFLSQDPYPWSAGNNQTLNRYVYGLNNSMEYMDINGLYAQEILQGDAFEYASTLLERGVNVNEKIDFLIDLHTNYQIAEYTTHYIDKLSRVRKWFAKTPGYGVNGNTVTYFNNLGKALRPGLGDFLEGAFETELAQEIIYEDGKKAIEAINFIIEYERNGGDFLGDLWKEIKATPTSAYKENFRNTMATFNLDNAKKWGGFAIETVENTANNSYETLMFVPNLLGDGFTYLSNQFK